MLILTRPKSGRMVTGVALGISELYNVPIALLRIAWVAAMIASPIVILIYLLLSISIPNEISVAGDLTIEGFSEDLPPRERFTRISDILVRRLVPLRSQSTIPANYISVGLLFAAAILELSKVEGAGFYYAHPIIASFFGYTARIGTAFFYSALAGISLGMRTRNGAAVALEMPVSEEFYLDRSARKMIGGVAAGLSSVVRIDPAYIRVLLLILNVLSFGFVGVLYFVIQYLFRRKKDSALSNILTPSPRNIALKEAGGTPLPRRSTNLLSRFALAVLFLAFAGVRISSEFRLFFFNEPFIQGTIFALLGIVFALHGALALRGGNGFRVASISLLAGSSIFFAGMYFLAITIGRVAITFGENIEIAEIIAALSIAYYGTVALRGHARRLILLLAIVAGLCAASIGFNLAPISDLAAVGQFYDFFYPIIFGVLALWSAFEN